MSRQLSSSIAWAVPAILSFALAAGISPELPRAYSFDEAGTLRVFDVSAPVVNGFLAELPPAITPPVDPDALFGTAPLVISPHSLTAFVAGRARLIVQPLQ